MNFVFMSPQFPSNYYLFCKQLKANGVNVLGVGDTPYDQLKTDLKNILTEYYKVDNMEDYNQVFKAIAFFSFKYGKIDWLESNNEYWLEQDAKLRTDFNITTGFKTPDMKKVKYKSEMKAYYKKAGIPTARYHLVNDYEGCVKFIEEVGYPVIVKPDNGVGAASTYRLKNIDELNYFFSTKDNSVPYIMEEYVYGAVCSYDAIINSKGEPIFETGNVSPISIMDIVNDKGSSVFYIVKNLPEDVRNAGRRTVAAFGVKSRYIHFEFFRLYQDQEGLGKKGDVIGLEVNMRPSGGVSPDMMNYANSVDVYHIWADMIVYDKTTTVSNDNHYYCVFVGRRDGRPYKYSHAEVLSKYRGDITISDRLPDALSGAMGNQMYMARFKEESQMQEYIAYVTAEV
ncbi:MAG: acetyl-CoA carboxylase biotin carboxylase subunit family protein [Lachnospiraceae bacterium]